jgi:hypothetical protein
MMAPRPETQADWLAERQAAGTARTPLDLGARLGRLVFGGAWSRSPAVQ